MRLEQLLEPYNGYLTIYDEDYNELYCDIPSEVEIPAELEIRIIAEIYLACDDTLAVVLEAQY